MSQAKLKVVENNTMDKENRSKSLEAAVSLIEKNYGKGSIMKLGSKANVDIESISTGSLGLDIALGIGGVPKGRIVEIYGPESSGKTTLATHIVAESQKKGGNCAFIDAEHALDPAYAKKLGVNLEELLISQPDTGEQGLEIADSLIKSQSEDGSLKESDTDIRKTKTPERIEQKHVNEESGLSDLAALENTIIECT